MDISYKATQKIVNVDPPLRLEHDYNSNIPFDMKRVVCLVALIRNRFSHHKLWRQAGMTEVCSRGQVVVSQPGPERSVHGRLEQGQAHRDPAQEPERAARMPQRQRALMGVSDAD